MIHDFENLTNEQLDIYNQFKQKICSRNTPLKHAKSEEDLRYIFENELNLLLRNLGFIETYEPFQHERHHSNGHIGGKSDFLYGNTIIEYKAFNLLSKKDIETEKIQAQNYLKDEKYLGIKMFGFLFDGVRLFIYTKDEKDTITENEKYGGILTAESFDVFLKTLFGNGVCQMSAQNLTSDFGIIDKNNNIYGRASLKLTKCLFRILSDDTNISSRTKLIFTEWEKLFRLAENDNGQHIDIIDRRNIFAKMFGVLIDDSNEYKALFALHTALSIIIKILLIRFMDDMPKNRINNYTRINIEKYYKSDSLEEVKSFFNYVETGVFFERIGVLNLTDNDFFAWYIKERFNDEIKAVLQEIIFKVSIYESIYLSNNLKMLDIFRDLYQNFIPKCVRHSFGEYYTPYWLAERTFMCATDGETDYASKTYIDPNCGSGTFLSVFYNYKHKDKNHKKIDFQEYAKGIVGVDINPIAILMAKANILLQAFKVCSFEITKKYEIPVYLADSLYTPNTIFLDGIECLEYKLFTAGLQHKLGVEKIEMVLPVNFVKSEHFTLELNKIENLIVKKDDKKALSILKKYIPRNAPKLLQQLEKAIFELIEFEKKDLNSIWLKIFGGYFRVATYDKFNYIVGNPAWVQWSVLPENYRKNVKNNIRLEGLFSSDKNVGGNNLNICALIANKCCERWLGDNGKFCFLMPKSILFNKSFEGFRKLLINGDEKLYFNEFLDFSNGGEIFEGVGIDFCAFKISKQPNIDENIVPMLDLKKIGHIAHNSDWSNAKQGFTKKNLFAVKLKTEINNNFLLVNSIDRAKYLQSLTGKFEYQFRKGVSVPYQMRLEFVALDGNNKNVGIFNPYQKIGNRLSVNKDVRILLELAYIKPFIIAPMLTDNGLKWCNSYAITPYEPYTKQPIPSDKLAKSAPLIFRYLSNIDNELGNGSKFNARIQTFTENYGILRMGSYVWGKCFVAIRDNTRLSPCLVKTLRTHWGSLAVPLFDNHISYISEVVLGKKEHRYIDEKEAQYILNKLSDKDVQEIILNSQDNRSISSRLPIALKRLK